MTSLSYHSRQPSLASSMFSSSVGLGIVQHPQKIGPWKLGKTLGRGATGKVLLATNIHTGQKAAVKVVSKSALDSEEVSAEKGCDSAGLPYGIEREIIIMKLLNHKNVLRLYDVWETSKALYLVLEYVESGELFDLLVEKGPLPEEIAVTFFRQIILGASYCHALGICHRDLKPENLLLDKDLNIKIADFGMAALESNERLLETSCGSPHYASPEIVSGLKYHGSASDVWSCGVILFALLTGRLPFDDANIRNLLLKVQSGIFEMPRELSPEAGDLISRMLTVDPKKRIKTQDILHQPLLLKYPINEEDLKVYNELPPPTAGLKPVNSKKDINPRILQNLVILWHGRAAEDIAQALLAPGANTEKTFYALLSRHDHDKQKLNNGSYDRQPITRENSIKRSSSFANKNRNYSNASTTPRKNKRLSAISASSPHKHSISFSKNGPNSLTPTRISPRRPLPAQPTSSLPPLPKNLYEDLKNTQYPKEEHQEQQLQQQQQQLSNPSSAPSNRFSLISSSGGFPTSGSSKRMSMMSVASKRNSFSLQKKKTTISPKKRRSQLRNSITSKLIATYARLAADSEWETLDRETKRTSLDFAKLCDQIFSGETVDDKEFYEIKALKNSNSMMRLAKKAKRKSKRQSITASKKRASQRNNNTAKGEADIIEDSVDSELVIDDRRAFSNPDDRKSKGSMLTKEEIEKMKRRTVSDQPKKKRGPPPRPVSKLDPRYLIYENYQKNGEFIEVEIPHGSDDDDFDGDFRIADEYMSEIRKSRLLNSKFDLQSIIKQEGRLSDAKLLRNASTAKSKRSSVLKGPRKLEDVKIPQVTRQSRYDPSKRLSVLSVYSTKSSSYDLKSILNGANPDKRASLLQSEIDDFSFENKYDTTKKKKNQFRSSMLAAERPDLRYKESKDTLISNDPNRDYYKQIDLPDIPPSPVKIAKNYQTTAELRDQDQENRPPPIPKKNSSALFVKKRGDERYPQQSEQYHGRKSKRSPFTEINDNGVIIEPKPQKASFFRKISFGSRKNSSESTKTKKKFKFF